MTTFIAKLLASKLLRKLGKVIIIKLLTHYVESTDNTLDNEVLDAVKKALV